MRFLVFVLGLVAIMIPVSVQAEIVVSKAISFATSKVQKNGAVFLTLESRGESADKLLSASGDIAEIIELHTHSMDGDMMQMREVEHYELPAGEVVTLEPMGHHIMLMGLKDQLHLGESFPLALQFENAGKQVITVNIVKPGEMDH